jgi:hypothetical protein
MRAKFHAIAAVVKGSDRPVTSTPSAFVADDVLAFSNGKGDTPDPNSDDVP